MKRILLSLLSACSFLSCSGDDRQAPETAAPEIAFGETNLTLSEEGETKGVRVTSNTRWSVAAEADWITLSVKEIYTGESILQISAGENVTGSGRSAAVTFTSGATIRQLNVSQGALTPEIRLSGSALSFDANGEKQTVTVTVNTAWTVETDGQWWYEVSAGAVAKGGREIEVTVKPNYTGAERTAAVVFRNGSLSEILTLTQRAGTRPIEDSAYIPEGYQLAWFDEFSSGDRPDPALWWYETGAGGWGNNEIQHYVDPLTPAGANLAVIRDGILTLFCKKEGDAVYSIRMNTAEGWTYGYFEARLKLPAGKGTWPAFWMMPQHFTAWPADGEIDIMEEVGYNPEYVSSSIHCTAYNHANRTQKTSERLLEGAQEDFHLYALEWTDRYIRTFVDGEELFRFLNDGAGNRSTWPFNAPFYLKLNLAWGGNWGGAQGVDESCLPAAYCVDYVRVYKRN